LAIPSVEIDELVEIKMEGKSAKKKVDFDIKLVANEPTALDKHELDTGQPEGLEVTTEGTKGVCVLDASTAGRVLKGAESLGAVTGSCCGTRLGAVGSSIGSTVEEPLEDSNGIEQMDPTNRSEVSL
jgi:hypothetical protein